MVCQTHHIWKKKVREEGKKYATFFQTIFTLFFSFEIGPNIYQMDFTHGPNEKYQFLVFLWFFQNGHIQATPTDDCQVTAKWKTHLGSQRNFFDWVHGLQLHACISISAWIV